MEHPRFLAIPQATAKGEEANAPSLFRRVRSAEWRAAWEHGGGLEVLASGAAASGEAGNSIHTGLTRVIRHRKNESG